MPALPRRDLQRGRQWVFFYKNHLFVIFVFFVKTLFAKGFYKLTEGTYSQEGRIRIVLVKVSISGSVSHGYKVVCRRLIQGLVRFLLKGFSMLHESFVDTHRV